MLPDLVSCYLSPQKPSTSTTTLHVNDYAHEILSTQNINQHIKLLWSIIRRFQGHVGLMSEQPDIISPKKDGSRTRRYILSGIILLVLSLAATQILLHQTSVGSQKFIGMTFLLYSGTAVVVLALLILATVLGRNLIKLYFERKSGQVGSGFKTKMVSTFIALSLLPAVLLAVMSYGLIRSSEAWLWAPPTQIMENSQALAQQYYSEAENRLKYFASFIAGYIQAKGPQSEVRLSLQELCYQYDLGNIRVFDNKGMLVADAGNKLSCPGPPEARYSLSDHQKEVYRLIAQSVSGKQQAFQTARVTPKNALCEITWATAPIWDSHGNVAGVILTESINSHSAKFSALSVEEGYKKYEQLKEEKTALRINTLLFLVLLTMLIVFAFSWFALYLAKRITVPIEALAQGAAAVAAGNLGYRVDCQAIDELGSLVTSFNRMTSDLQENEKRIESTQQSLVQTNTELDNRRRYIETILQTIAAGVISLDSDFRIRTMNQAATRMLQAENLQVNSRLEDVVPSSAGKVLRSLLQKAAVLGTVVRNIEISLQGKSIQLAATVTPLDDITGRRRGWVIVLDDMTELIRMEKMSAWQEVARRMAHEIKNPLTPIQLSAERILYRFKQIFSPDDFPEPQQEELAKYDKLLNECVRTIIQEADSLKSLVDEFSHFARLPEVRLEEKADLHQIIENALNLYDGRISGVRVQKDFDANIPALRLDPEQMKRVFINLVDNALEAMAENSKNKLLHIRTSLDLHRQIVSIEVADTGRGFPEEYQGSLFLPYFSTRKGGTGLGLAIVRQIVTDHHGNVRAESNPPGGAKIIIDLPLGAGVNPDQNEPL
jgi:two-component system, NtrC family, nitrogen regulation sensor histidine kinase NtrY